MPSYTPWVVHDDGSDTLTIRLDVGKDKLGPVIAIVPNGPIQRDRAHLIAAAPKMLAALTTIYDSYEARIGPWPQDQDEESQWLRVLIMEMRRANGE